VATEDRGWTRIITLNRPAVRNAINADLASELNAALLEFDRLEHLSSAIITGAGGSFCSGVDLRAFSGHPARASAISLEQAVRWTTRKPVIAAVDGFALGGGFELVLACDLVVAERGALFGLPEARHGLVAAGGGLLRLPGRIPLAVATEIALTGRPLQAGRLHELGLINRLAEAGHTLDVALELSGEVGSAGRLAVAESKALLQGRSYERSLVESWAEQDAVVGRVNSSEQAREGVRAFLEKRRPSWATR
jgi:enoyl-CoA hydratase